MSSARMISRLPAMYLDHLPIDLVLLLLVGRSDRAPGYRNSVRIRPMPSAPASSAWPLACFGLATLAAISTVWPSVVVAGR
jgi:hypothetical protein